MTKINKSFKVASFDSIKISAMLKRDEEEVETVNLDEDGNTKKILKKLKTIEENLKDNIST
jgi:hypothetical protein